MKSLLFLALLLVATYARLSQTVGFYNGWSPCNQICTGLKNPGYNCGKFSKVCCKSKKSCIKTWYNEKCISVQHSKRLTNAGCV